MKKKLLAVSVGLFTAFGAFAQTQDQQENKETILSIKKENDTVSVTTKKGGSISMGPTGGIVVASNDTTKKNKKVEFSFFNMDLGVNFMNDKTNYQSAEAAHLLQVPEAYRNETLFSLRQGNSWNYNIWPVTTKFNLAKGSAQSVHLNVGVGFQIFNFKYNKPVHFTNDARPMVTLREDVPLQKNKLSVMYASVPVMLTGNTKLTKGVGLHYGFGVIGGMNISTWTKQKTEAYGIEKNHDMFNTDRFQVSLQAELGLQNFFTLFGTYQLNSLFKDGIYQQPISIGIRL